MTGLVWRPGVQREGDCRLLGVNGVEDAFELCRGVARRTGWPDDAYCEMDPDFPKDIALSDSPAGAGALVVSKRVRTCVESFGVNRCEFLPITVINHKRRVASSEYFVLNPLDFCECIDMNSSQPDWNTINSDVLCGCRRLVIRWEQVPEHYNVFHLKHWPNVVLVRQALAEALVAARLSGLHLIKPEDYTGIL